MKRTLILLITACGPSSGPVSASTAEASSSTSSTSSTSDVPTSATAGEACVALAGLGQPELAALCLAHPLSRPACGVSGSLEQCLDVLAQACAGPTTCDFALCTTEFATTPCGAERPTSCEPFTRCEGPA